MLKILQQSKSFTVKQFIYYIVFDEIVAEN